MEAHLLRMRLGAAGIDAFLQDENMIQMDYLYSNLLGGVKVQVADEDVPAVRELLAEDHGIEADRGEDETEGT